VPQSRRLGAVAIPGAVDDQNPHRGRGAIYDHADLDIQGAVPGAPQSVRNLGRGLGEVPCKGRLATPTSEASVAVTSWASGRACSHPIRTIWSKDGSQ
jgi:hypothetical protein